MAQNIQTFAGDVVVPGTLKANLVTIEDPILTLGSNNYVDKASNTGFIINRFDSNANVAFYFDETNEQLRLAYTASVGTDKNIVVDENTDLEINVFGYVSAYGFRGDGGLLSNLVTDLQSVTEYGASSDQTLVLSNVTTALDATEGNVVVAGNVTASTFFGDGANLTGIAATLEEIIINGNVTSNVMELQNATSLITTGKVGIANSAPQHDLSVGANLYVEDVGSNVLTVEGNISAHQLTLGTIEITPGYGLENVTNISNISYQTLILSNAQTAFVSTAKAGIGIEPDAADVGAAGLHVDGHLRLGGAADNTDEEAMDIKAAGALNVLANESDTDNTNTGLLLRAGGVNESNITMYGDLSTADKQYMSFATRSEERMRIHGDGNVSIGHTAANYMLDVAGDANCVSLSIQDLTINTIGLSVLYDVDNILENGNVTTNVLTLGKVTVTDPTLSAAPTSNIVTWNATTSEFEDSGSNVSIDSILEKGNVTTNVLTVGKVTVTNPTVATVASNLVTWNATTSEFEDSGGLISNKLSIVSEQPPSALTANSTTLTDHGVYKVTTSSLAAYSNAWNAFDDETAVTWMSADTYTGVAGAYAGSVQLNSNTSTGEWLSVELPYKATLRYMKLTPGDIVDSYPLDANLYATNDSVTWDLLKEWTGVTPASATEEQTVFVNASDAYKKYAIVTTKIAGTESSNVSLGEWKMFCESFTVDGGKVKLASTAVTGGETVVDQTSAHARESAVLKKYPEVAMTSNVQGGYIVSVASADTSSSRTVHGAFDGKYDRAFGQGWQSGTRYSTTTGLPTGDADNATFTVDSVDYTGQWVKLELPKKIRVESIVLSSCYNTANTDDRRPEKGAFLGSNDNTNWELIKSFDNDLDYADIQDVQDSVSTRVNAQVLIRGITNTTHYKYIMLVITKIATTNLYGPVQINELEYHGYEEVDTEGDTSLDTTITSKYNTPDLTDASVYIDGLKGSAATDYSGNEIAVTENNITWDSTEKAWVFSGAANANIVTGDLGLKGDQPHSVSAWVRADALNFDGLFHLGAPDGYGDSASRVRFEENAYIAWGGDNRYLANNEWHNVTYTYNGEGGQKKLFVDGELVATEGNEDTFLPYPPLITANEQHGFHALASSQLSNYPARFAFDGELTHAQSLNSWISESSKYNTSTGAYVGSESTTVDGVAQPGEWIQLMFPHRMIIDCVNMAPQTDSEMYRSPKDFIIAGSVDGNTWETLRTVTGVTLWKDNTYTPFYIDTNKNKAYKYARIIISKNQGGDASAQYVSIAEIKFYARRVNDLVRFPNPTDTLKYPPFVMEADSERGYTWTSASNTFAGYNITYNSGSNERFHYIMTDDATDTYYFGLYDVTTTGPFDTTTGYWDTTNFPNLKLSASSSTPAGEWIALEMPCKILLSRVEIATRTAIAGWFQGEAVRDFELWGTNDDSSWSLIQQYTDTPVPTSSAQLRSFDVSTTTAYKKIAIIVTRNGSAYTGATGRPVITIAKLRFYGTQPEDVVARIGDGFEGKLRNFRVYATALSHDRVRQIYDADKDEFALTDSSITVYRGRLGIGTNTPSAALTVRDDIGELEEFPPIAMSSDTMYVDGHGIFKASSTTVYNSNYAPYMAFDKIIPYNTSKNQWVARSGTYDGETPSAATEQHAYSPIFNGIHGAWIQLEMPYKILLKRMSSYIRLNRDHEHPSSGILYGSNDGFSTYDIVYTFNDVAISDNYLDGVHHEINLTRAYSAFRLQITKIGELTGGNTFAVLGQLKFFGKRSSESTLQDGELTLTRNLHVPRIGPKIGLDADMPSPGHLLIDYDTSSNYHAAVVVDTSGKNNNAAYSGTANYAYYDDDESAFYMQSGGYIKHTSLENCSGDFEHSISMWVKMYETGSGATLFWMGENVDYKRINVYNTGQNDLYYSFRGTDLQFTTGINLERWTHIACVYGGSRETRHVYIDGVRRIPDAEGGTFDSLNIANSDVYLGSSSLASGYQGWMSGIKFWSGYALTPGDVRKIYERGRNPNFTPPLVMYKTPVTIGNKPYEGYHLDVGGKIRAGSTSVASFTGQHLCVPSNEDMEEGLIVSADKNTFFTVNDGVNTGLNGIRIDESLPVVSLSKTANDKKVFGVISTMENANTSFRSQTTGGLVSDASKILGDNRAIVNSVGEGAIWVCDAGGPLDSGDYITTSNVPGYGMAQSDDLLHNYTVAKITMDCDFTASNVAVRTIKKEITGLRTITEDAWDRLPAYERDSNSVTQYSNTLSVEAWSNLATEDASGYDPTTVTTTVDYTDGSNLISIAEWSNLAPGDQELYTANTHTEIVDYTKFIDVGQWSNLEAGVQNTFSEAEVVTYYRKQWGQNVLDDRGNLIWEEKTGEWEAPYKTRFLLADGTETDEANCVHRAAFVGCTYHCG